VRAAGHLFWLCYLLYPRRAVKFPSFSFRECPLRCVSLRHGRKRSSPPRRRPSEPRAGSEREDDSDTVAFSKQVGTRMEWSRRRRSKWKRMHVAGDRRRGERESSCGRARRRCLL
jgi:hypothetical protein